MNTLKPQEYSLLHFVQIYRKALNPKQCTSIISKINDTEWSSHLWASYTGISEGKEPNTNCDRASISGGTSRLLLSGIINNVINDYRGYVKKVLGTEYGFNGMTVPGINRYNVGRGMSAHVDHITTIFDGETRGIPTLSVVGLLNDEFEGGKFNFWDKYDMNLEIGDILVFPSNFLYKHHVDTVTSGTRYSFVSWIF
jgi:predicted 2-oxoglutarate/Fe(II)-dependent dioxygenase YbiX